MGDRRPPLVAELKPDVVLMDYRMPGMNGAEATRAVLEAYAGHEGRLPERVGDGAGGRRGARGGRGRLRDEGRGLRPARADRAGSGGRVNLTAENTAVVLDSTADFPEAPERYPNFRVVPLYVRFGEESFKDYVEITPERFYERLQTEPALPTTSQPTPGDFLATFEELAPQYERILVAEISSTLVRHVRQRADRGRDARRRPGARDRHAHRVASLALLAIGVQQRLERGTTDEEIDAFVERYQREHHLLFTVNTLEYLAKGGRIGRAAAFAGQPAEREADPRDPRRRGVPLKKVRGNHKAFAEFREQFESTTTDSPNLKVGIAHAAAPERLQALRELVEHERPQAQIEIATTLGAVVGTHAGPGTVGFFWFEDEA